VVSFVLDTNVVSALRTPNRNPEVFAWAASVPAELTFITALTVAEIGRGICAMERHDRVQGDRLRTWFRSDVLGVFAERMLPFDTDAALIFASYRVLDRAPMDDALIAAIAQAHGMTVATRNTRHFEPLVVETINPYEYAARHGS
jgi:predicted nucleic acid-binding protein